MRATRKFGFIAVIVTLGIATACSGPTDGSDTHAKRATDGPLVVSEGSSGAMTLRTYRSSPRRAVFGGLLLCTNGRTVDIEEVRFTSDQRSASLTAVLREVPDAQFRSVPDSIHWAPVSAWRGDLFSPRVQALVPGLLVTDIRGYTVNRDCDPPSPSAARLELLTMVAAGAAGVSVTEIVIDYAVDGHEYSAHVPWSYTLCGEASERSGC